ncbi:MAG: MBL fold metallo-hydrolase [Oscillospiraceae bacterium]|jgi:glyoxylase-like metal-dependent hydrolase (beta-lactamase superfamily II)|nr:MBL fold metallo-hydrolase [Oscillospiraceae bacterium]
MKPMIDLIKCGMAVNCYILSQGDSAVLVDTGTANYRETILERCRAANVRLILLTHGHYDHAQNAAFLSRELGAPVAMHPADAPLLADILADPISAHAFQGKVMAAFIRVTQRPALKNITAKVQKNEIPPFAVDIKLRDGFSLEPYGLDARVIALPGHTRGSVGVAAGKDLLAGDALMNISRPGRTAHYVDRAAMETSAAAITALGEGVTVWFGHGGPAGNRAW